MKRFLVIPIMFIYLLAVTGVMIHAHYCGQELESWNMYVENNGCPEGECGDEKGEPDGCCKDEVIAAKVSYDQDVVTAFKIKATTTAFVAVASPSFYWVNEPVILTAAKLNDNRANAPPGIWQHIPLYKLHSSFTFYG
jgi:hypothetical protein